MASVVRLLVFAAVVAGSLLVGRMCICVVRRHLDRLQWEHLVARHRELDHRLESIWQHR